MKAKTVVVGGGVMGVSVAMHAARGTDPITEPVILIEKDHLAAGSSGRSGAVLRQFYSDREIAGMARDSMRFYASLERNTGRSAGHQRAGVLTLAGPERPDALELIDNNVEMMTSIGIDARRVDASAIRELVPGIEVGDGVVGVFEPEGGFVDPVRAVETFAALARTYGAITRLGERVTDIVTSNGRVTGVVTSTTTYEAENVVIAAGPWSKELLTSIGVDYPFRVVRPEQHLLETPTGESEHDPGFGGLHSETSSIGGVDQLEDDIEDRFGGAGLRAALHPVLIDLEYEFYTRCDPERGRTRVGGMNLELDAAVADPDHVDEEVGEEFKAWARNTLEKRLPCYTDCADAESFVGMYTLTPDCQAIIGPVEEVDGLFVVSGFSGHGFKLAPSIGEGVAQMVNGEPVSAFDPEFFARERFTGATAASSPRGFGL